VAHESGSSQVVDSKHTQSAHVGIASQHKWNLRALIKALHTYFRHSGLFTNAHPWPRFQRLVPICLCQHACVNMLVPTWKSSGADSWIFTAGVPQDQDGNVAAHSDSKLRQPKLFTITHVLSAVSNLGQTGKLLNCKNWSIEIPLSMKEKSGGSPCQTH
jgi:hypothetical protein